MIWKLQNGQCKPGMEAPYRTTRSGLVELLLPAPGGGEEEERHGEAEVEEELAQTPRRRRQDEEDERPNESDTRARTTPAHHTHSL